MKDILSIEDLKAALRAEAGKIGLDMVPIIIPTMWEVGPVAAYLLPGDPVTLIDAGIDGDEAREIFESAFAGAGRSTSDLERIVVTHGHNDHFGGAKWLQEVSGCEVLMHREDAERIPGGWGSILVLFSMLGLSEKTLDELRGGRAGGRRHWEIPLPEIESIEGGEIYQAGEAKLVVEHYPGHSPGHIWVVEETTGAIFGGDYLLESSATTAGAVPDPAHPIGIRPMLAEYEDGLRALAERDVPVVFPSHGPPVTDHRRLIERRMVRSAERTERVFAALKEAGETSPFDLTKRVHGERVAHGLFQFLTEVFGRLELLAGEGRAAARLGAGGIWRYRAI